jgi:hypothetical protein
MSTSEIVITIGFVWLLASIVVGIVVGRVLAFGMGTDNRNDGWEDFEPDTRIDNPIMEEIEQANKKKAA